MLAAALLLAAVFGPPTPIELRKAVARPCPSATAAGDIVVCARHPTETPRLGKPPEAVTPPSRDPLSFRVPGDGTARIHAIQSNVGGFTGRGAAVTLGIPLGKRRRATR